MDNVPNTDIRREVSEGDIPDNRRSKSPTTWVREGKRRPTSHGGRGTKGRANLVAVLLTSNSDNRVRAYLCRSRAVENIESAANYIRPYRALYNQKCIARDDSLSRVSYWPSDSTDSGQIIPYVSSSLSVANV